MDEEGKNVQLFMKTVVDLASMGAEETVQQTTYLGLIAYSMASIADSLEKMSDHMIADSLIFKKAWDEYRKAREEEWHV